MPRFLFPLEYSTELLMPSLPCLRACSLDRFPQESRSPCADGCSPVRASWSLAPPTSKAIPNSNDILLVGEDTEFLFSSVLEICLVFVAQRRASSARLHPSFFLSEVRSFGLADATAYAFYRLPFFAGRHRPFRTPRSCPTRWLPSLAPLSSPDDYTRLLGVSRCSWYQIVAYPGDCLVGVL